MTGATSTGATATAAGVVGGLRVSVVFALFAVRAASQSFSRCCCSARNSSKAKIDCSVVVSSISEGASCSDCSALVDNDEGFAAGFFPDLKHKVAITKLLNRSSR